MSIFFGFAPMVHAEVVINEIAWMGTTVSVNDEWIELYNTGNDPVVLDGWKLKAFDGSPLINLQGTISGNGYALLERTDDTTVAGVTATVVYSGALANEGEKLTLLDDTDQVIDTVDMISGWTAGNSTTKETMQRSGASWITNTPTPGAQNATSSNNTGGGDSNSSDNPDSETDEGDSPTPAITTKSKERVIKIEPDPIYSATMIIPETIVQQVPSEFGSLVKKDGALESLRGRFEWSMGDGSFYIFPKSTSFNYTYQEPGEYVVTLGYYSNVFKEKPDTIHKQVITVFPADISVEKTTSGVIILTNNSGDDIDLGGWVLNSGESSFRFPRYTILQKELEIKIPQSVHGLPGQNILLITPSGFLASPGKIKNSFIGLNKQNNTEESLLTEDTDGLQELYTNSDESSSQKLPKIKSIPSSTIVWIVLFITLLIIGLIGLHLIINKLEPEEGSKN